MKTMRMLLLSGVLLTIFNSQVYAQYAVWRHTKSMFILTTPEGANLPLSATEYNFPLLVRLNAESFDFKQADASGKDIRFSSGGSALAYQVEEWDASKGVASIWVKIPVIKGNSNQEIKVFWGNPNALDESNGKAVFNESNEYLSVWHMNYPVKDELGMLESKDMGTSSSSGAIGKSRYFAGGKGIDCGEKVTTYPLDSSPHTSEAWFRAEKPNGTIFAWGNDRAQGKVVMQFTSPLRIKMDTYMSNADVSSASGLSMDKWIHVVHTYQKGDSRIYINGVLDGVTTAPSINKSLRNLTLAIKNPVKVSIGGWNNNFSFIGDIDEVRVSKVVRSADWIKLEYENQKVLQTLVGSLVNPGANFTVSKKNILLMEGNSSSITARADGALKLYWILKQEGQDSIVSVDRSTFIINSGRVVGNKSFVLQVKAVYPKETKILNIPVTVKENIPDPVFTLKAPATWDGSKPLIIEPQISNLELMKAKGMGNLNYVWAVSGIAVMKQISTGKLILKSPQNSGKMTLTAVMNNGGKSVTQTAQIWVKEPKKTGWVYSEPERNEQPEDNQFYARDDKNKGNLYYNGVLGNTADSVFLRVYADEKIFKFEKKKSTLNKEYAFSVKLTPGLILYKVEFGTKTAGKETILRTVRNIVCGDAYLINGQSNAVAAEWGNKAYPETNAWVRSYGSAGNDPGSVLWGNAVRRSEGDRLAIGYWGFDLATYLVETQKIPICIINGAVGGTRIDQHQRNKDNHQDLTTIYGRLLWRVEKARLANGIRGMFWYQGENDQGADGPDGTFGYVNYKEYFINMAAAWKQDYPNINHNYMFQIWPKSCAMGVNGSDNNLREVQRTLPTNFSNFSIMSTLGVKPAGTCHFTPEGYADIAHLIEPLVDKYHYGKAFTKSITPPNLKRAYYTNDKRDEIGLVFDQPVIWSDSLKSQFYIGGKSGLILSGRVSGNEIIVKLKNPSIEKTVTYLDSKSWSQDNILYGENGIAALTFFDVPLK